MRLRYVVADVFTDTALTGNQLAVFTDGRDVDEETMQKLAREMNFSETVFVLPPEDGGHARIRIFTPSSELPFAGHPVLGSAFVLAAPLQLGEIRLETSSGVVPVTLQREGAGINCFAGSGKRWKTRMFAPSDGVPEDPATGSAAGPLAIHLARHGRIGFGDEIEISQGAELKRPSKLHARVEGSADRIERVEV